MSRGVSPSNARWNSPSKNTSNNAQRKKIHPQQTGRYFKQRLTIKVPERCGPGQEVEVSLLSYFSALVFHVTSCRKKANDFCFFGVQFKIPGTDQSITMGIPIGCLPGDKFSIEVRIPENNTHEVTIKLVTTPLQQKNPVSAMQ